ncbi:MAG TPA: ABC transporter ATP-binding protein [Aestuariivirgaceae bacterium]|nr:ABC transporter ATP-binding protein [Aestuariivirgaceae bacterium]
MSAPATTLLRAIDIEKRYGATAALDGVSLDIEDGEFLTLLGPSGSGKTTFLMILAGFVAPTRGRLEEDGADVTERPPEERHYGMVFQGYALFPHMTVEDNIAFPLRTRGVGSGERRRRVHEIVEIVGLTEHLKKRPSQLSGGQQQRVALARALVYSPKVMLLDEPLSALDKNLREQMQVELRRLHIETGTTFVFVTHDQSEALALSSRVAIFDHGRLHQVGTPHAVYEQPSNRFVAEFLGQINLFAIEAPVSTGNVVRGRFEDTELASSARSVATNGKAVVAVRPEHLTIGRGVPDPGLNGVTARVTSAVYGGARINLVLETSGGTKVVMEVPAAQVQDDIEPGAAVRVEWPIEKSFLLPGEEAT